MSSLSPEPRPALGLRERKKAKTRAAIQEHALRLFRQQGYTATTVEQIAAAAEISPSTFFRYFPTKEDVVLTDDYDPLLAEAFAAQPPGLSPIQAVRGAMGTAFGAIPAAELAQVRERLVLIQTVPELRAATLDNLVQTMRLMAELVAKRVGRNPDDFAVRTFAGALLGVWLSVIFGWADDPDVDLAGGLDAAMAHLQAGLPF
jgi:AcrR family transcriptional regulator